MREILFKLFPTWIYWLAVVFTIAGVIYSIGNNLPWIGFLVLIPLTIAALDAAVRGHRLNVKLQNDLQAAESVRTEAQQRLQTVSSDHLVRIQELLLRGSFEACFDTIYSFTAYIGRLKRLSKTNFELRNLFVMGEALYVAAKAPGNALLQLQEDDPFMMYSTLSGMHHPIAKLRLHQVNEKEEAIFLEVVGELDKATVGSLRTLAQSASVRGLKGYKISPEINTEAFAKEDMEAVARVLGILRDIVNKTT